MLGPPETESPPVVAATEGPETSTGKGLNNKDTTRSVDDYARERYRLDGQIKRLLRVDALKIAPNKFPANVHRMVGCTWNRIGQVSLVRPRNRTSYHYKGVATCGSVHACPICASKIQERRRLEVVQAIAYCASIERAPMMASITFPHRVEQPLGDLLKLQAAALKHLRGSRGYMALMLKARLAGRIRTLEVTHGQNGWHPHTHELLFVGSDVPACWMRHELSKLWLKSCTKVGLFRPERDSEAAFLRHAVDVRAGDEGVAGYMAKMDDQSKWGLSHEMTKGSSKQGRRSGSHPFRLAIHDSTAHLFVEYVHSMKGQRQLVWSRGLKAAVGVEDKTDEQIAQEENEKADDRIPVDRGAWRVVLGNDARWELTYAAKVGGEPEVRKFLQLLGWNDGNGDDG